MHLSPTDAGAVARRAGDLLAAGRLDAYAYTLCNVLLWRCRSQGQAMTRQVSYTTLTRLTGQCRERVGKSLAALEASGLLVRVKSRIRVAWGGAVASRQGTSAYLFRAPDTEFARRPDSESPGILLQVEAPQAAVRVAQAALAERAAAVRRGLSTGIRSGLTRLNGRNQ